VDQDVDVACDIATVWARIETHAGETFRQKRGAPFTYATERGAVRPDRTNRTIRRNEFAKALSALPLRGPGQVQHLHGPSYIYAVLTDPRIRRNDW
jgi:hypothetical protein